jgi:hypothetical protein
VVLAISLRTTSPRKLLGYCRRSMASQRVVARPES